MSAQNTLPLMAPRCFVLGLEGPLFFAFVVFLGFHVFYSFSPTAESFGVSAKIGSGVVRGGPEVRGFHEGSTRVPPGFHQGSTRVPPGFHKVLRGLRGGASTKKSTACCWGYHLSLFFVVGGGGVQKQYANFPDSLAIGFLQHQHC